MLCMLLSFSVASSVEASLIMFLSFLFLGYIDHNDIRQSVIKSHCSVDVFRDSMKLLTTLCKRLQILEFLVCSLKGCIRSLPSQKRNRLYGMKEKLMRDLFKILLNKLKLMKNFPMKAMNFSGHILNRPSPRSYLSAAVDMELCCHGMCRCCRE